MEGVDDCVVDDGEETIEPVRFTLVLNESARFALRAFTAFICSGHVDGAWCEPAYWVRTELRSE